MHIVNHATPMDVLFVIALMKPWCSHMGKKEALKMPLVKVCCDPLEFIMVGRDTKDSKESRL